MLPNCVHLDVTEPVRKVWTVKSMARINWDTEPKISDLCNIRENHAQHPYKFYPRHPISQDQFCLKLLRHFLSEEETVKLLQDIATAQGSITIYLHEAVL